MKKSLLIIFLLLFLINRGFSFSVGEIPLYGNQVETWKIVEPLSSDSTVYIAVLLSPPSHIRGKSILIVYRFHKTQGITEHWRTTYPENRQGCFRDVTITDINKNGLPELCLLLNNNIVSEHDNAAEWLQIYEWNGSTFPNLPTQRISTRVDPFSRAQPTKIVSGYFTTTAYPELAVLFPGTLRKVFVLNSKGRLAAEKWSVVSEVVSKTFLSNVGKLNVFPVYWDRAPLADVVFTMYDVFQESYAFSYVTLQNGKSIEKAQITTPKTSFSIDSLHIKRMKKSLDTPDELLLVNAQNQGALIKKESENELLFLPLTFDKPYSLLNTDGRDILTFYNDSVTIWKKGLNTHSYVPDDIYPIPFTPTEGYCYCTFHQSIFAAGTHDNNTLLTVASLSQAEHSKKVSPKAISDFHKQKDINRDSSIQPDKRDIAAYLESCRKAYDAVLKPGDTFSQILSLDPMNPGSLTLEWIAPEGAIINLKTGLIYWKVTQDQLNAHDIYLSISNQQDTNRTTWSVYVNDPVKIVNETRFFMATASTPFSFQVDIQDKNENPDILFKLEGLEGGGINQKGLVTWMPDDKHLDIQSALIKVTDGFSVDSARFIIYVNDPVKIVSTPQSLVLPVNERWTYSLVVEDRNNPHVYEYSFQNPLEINFEHVLKKEKLFVQRKGEVIDIRPFIQTIDFYDKNLVLTLTPDFNPDSISLKEILGGCLDLPLKDLPHFYLRQLKTIKYALEEPVPKGMEIFQDGQVIWCPSLNQCNDHRVVLLVSDGFSTEKQILNLYVNSPPVIISKPENIILNPGDTFTYMCQVEDKNSEAHLTYKIGKNSPPAQVDSFGNVRWNVGEDDYDYHQLTVIAHDGFAADSVQMLIYVNDPVRILPPPPMIATTKKSWHTSLKYEDKNAAHIYRIQIDRNDSQNLQKATKDFLQSPVVLVSPKIEGDSLMINVRPAVHQIYFSGQDLLVDCVSSYVGKISLQEILAGILGCPIEAVPPFTVSQDKKVTFSLLDGPEGLTLSQDGHLRWTPKSFQFGTYSITVRATDTIVSDTLTFSIFVNSPPYIVSTPQKIIHYGEIWEYSVIIEDLNDEQQKVLCVISAPEGVSLKLTTKTLVWTPDSLQSGFNTFEIEVSDGYDTMQQVFQVFVNMPPKITSKPSPVALVGKEYTAHIQAEDVNGDNVRLKALQLPLGATFDKKTGKITWKPKNSNLGKNTFRIACTDSHNKTIYYEFDVHVFKNPSARKFQKIIFPVAIIFSSIVGLLVIL